jgi:cytochrome c-type biogenesis protein CcmE
MNVTSLLWSIEGRISRGEYWLGLLLLWLLSTAIFLLGVLLTVAAGGSRELSSDISGFMLILAIPLSLVFLPIHVKRYHDLGRRGWWALIFMVPLVSLFAIAECGFRLGEPKPNAYGPPPKGLSRKQQRLALIGSGLVLVSFAFIAMGVGFRDAIVFFNSPTDVVEKQIKPGTRMRLGGLVKNGSISRGENLAVRFDITDGNNTIAVTYQGLLPDLFREGQGVVTEGTLESATLFKADSVLAKHDETYMPKEVADALKKQGHWKAGGEGAAGAGPPGGAR